LEPDEEIWPDFFKDLFIYSHILVIGSLFNSFCPFLKKITTQKNDVFNG
jgi:hypothetical protein